jgi:hypothetical protein
MGLLPAVPLRQRLTDEWERRVRDGQMSPKDVPNLCHAFRSADDPRMLANALMDHLGGKEPPKFLPRLSSESFVTSPLLWIKNYRTLGTDTLDQLSERALNIPGFSDELRRQMSGTTLFIKREETEFLKNLVCDPEIQEIIARAPRVLSDEKKLHQNIRTEKMKETEGFLKNNPIPDKKDWPAETEKASDPVPIEKPDPKIPAPHMGGKYDIQFDGGDVVHPPAPLKMPEPTGP